ncbi:MULTISPECIES: hypothetical protein [Paraburkholderia]|jgi:hypothetical protein|uniref:Uncharacterized protein n=2 Tax=Paraburkholderia TaxID=1822464 RepID=A0A1H7A9J3_9BURK|nr:MULTISPECIES: hypothetical protein [Paraburkholderia]SEJ58560.1 hypothetical protein SAMN05192539_1013148 [Paraburkholderia diazotrophica]SIT50294.1 conserved hypothetical protein [Paraburkholderia piptadeniae]
MASINISDLPLNLALDRKAMSAISGGGGAPWVFGWITPFVQNTPSVGPVVNLYDVTNNFYANQMINQFQTVNVQNTGNNSNVITAPDERSLNRA